MNLRKEFIRQRKTAWMTTVAHPGYVLQWLFWPIGWRAQVDEALARAKAKAEQAKAKQDAVAQA